MTEEQIKESEKKEDDVLAKIDECLDFLKKSPSEATARKAAELEGLILKWRERLRKCHVSQCVGNIQGVRFLAVADWHSLLFARRKASRLVGGSVRHVQRA